MDALELLKKDHDMIKQLLEKANTYQEMKQLFENIRSGLEAHSDIEEKLFYPKLQNREYLKELVKDAREQHLLMKQLLGAMKDQQGQEFEKSFQTLKAEVQLHFTSEEGEIFPQVQSLKNGPNMMQLGDELEAAKLQYQIANSSARSA